MAAAPVPQPLAPGRTAALAVRERHTQTRSLSLRDAGSPHNQICPYLTQPVAPAAVMARLGELCEKGRQIHAAREEIDRIERQRGTLEARGNELRDNLRAIEKIPTAAPLRAELLAKLTDHERRSAELQKQLVSRREAEATAEAYVAQLLSDLSVGD